LAHNFKFGHTLTYHEPLSSSKDSPCLLFLEENVQNYKEHNDRPIEQVKSLVSIVLPFLPPDELSVIQQQSNQVLSQQEPPRQKEPLKKQQDDDNDYVGY